jgi:hypothetical protein
MSLGLAAAETLSQTLRRSGTLATVRRVEGAETHSLVPTGYSGNSREAEAQGFYSFTMDLGAAGVR